MKIPLYKSTRLNMTATTLLLALSLLVHAQDQKEETHPLNDTICEIQKLESNRDPKCHATATRLENFMYGTKLTNETRFLKVKLQKELVLNVWQKASAARAADNNAHPPKHYILRQLDALATFSNDKNGNIIMHPKGRKEVTLSSVDADHYSSVAYSLRSVLALQQETLFRGDLKLMPLDAPSVAVLKKFLDLFTLGVLKEADHNARLADNYSLTPEQLTKTWTAFLDTTLPEKTLNTPATKTATKTATLQGNNGETETLPKFATLNAIIEQKIKSYEKYNKISMQVFIRNLQVYFARHRWPKDPEMGKKFKDFFTEAMIAFSFEGLQLAEEEAEKAGHPFIREEDVHKMWQTFVPFDVNEYEDVIFFPNLETPERLTIEAYDFDAFRDSGIHWRYLQFALKDHGSKLKLEPDPFAAELLVEGIAQFGVLTLRIAGQIAKETGHEGLRVEHLDKALHSIRNRIAKHRTAQPTLKKLALPESSENITRFAKGDTFFTDVTAASGVNFQHRSSDWLSRMLRSYLKQSATVGTLTIPPAFGGSGAAVGDINNDGNDDLLILSGSGNALYLSDGKGKFHNVTEKAGIVFKREDGKHGEPRQPIIADMDNDGYQDILITYVNDRHRLYRNRGDGTFVDVSARAGLGGENAVGGPAVVADFDNDGLPDIYICYFGDYIHGILPMLARVNRNGMPNKLFRNKGNMEFEDVTEKSGVGDTGWGQAAAHSDFDRDGLQDLIVGNDFGVNVYYRNKGDGTFENVADQMGTGKPSFTMNIGITDLNRDGYPDFYISNIVTLVKDEKYVLPGEDTTMRFHPEKLGRMRIIEANDLFISDLSARPSQTGNATMDHLRYVQSEAVGRGYSSTGWAWDADFFDFDNDGDDDLYCVNGMNEYAIYSDTPYYTELFKNRKGMITIPVYEKESNVFFVNQGGKLENHSRESGTDYLGNSRSTVYLDFDNDGDLDIVLNNYHGPARVYRNNSQQLGNHWLKVKLTGDPSQKSNRDAIGARIIVTDGDKQIAWREIHGGHGYLSMDSKTQHVGLGKLTHANLEITWPNGQVSHFKNVPANTGYEIRQKDGSIQPFNR